MSSSYDIAFESFNWREIPGGVSAAEGLRGLLKANDRREVEAVYFDIENVASYQLFFRCKGKSRSEEH